MVLVFNHDLEVSSPYSNNYACTYIHSLECPLELTRLIVFQLTVAHGKCSTE